jgi:hypothetical protein
MGMNHAALEKEGDFLLLETDTFEGELVSQRQLKRLIRAFSVELELVFVGACKSRFVGEIFQRAGAKHVICVRAGSEVLDDAALTFTRRFYKCIFAGETICVSFNKAKSEVESRYKLGQANMFQMLLAEEMVAINSHGLK